MIAEEEKKRIDQYLSEKLELYAILYTSPSSPSLRVGA